MHDDGLAKTSRKAQNGHGRGQKMKELQYN